MALQLFIYDNRIGSSLVYQLAAQDNATSRRQFEKLKEDISLKIINIIDSELGNPASTLVQVVISKG